MSLKLFSQYVDFLQHPYEDLTIDPADVIKEAPTSPSSSLVEFYKNDYKDECWFTQIKNERGRVIFLNLKRCEPSSIECKFDSSRVQKVNEVINGEKLTEEYYPGTCGDKSKEKFEETKKTNATLPMPSDFLNQACDKKGLYLGCNNPPHQTSESCSDAGVFYYKQKERKNVKLNCCVQTSWGWECYFHEDIKPWDQGGMVSPKLDIPWDQQTGYDQVLVQPQQCPSNSKLVDGRCLCDMGFESKNGVCIPALAPEQKCKEVGGSFDQLSNKCIMCPPGLVYQGNGKCGCEKGFEYIGNQCVPACAPPMFRNERAECLSCEQFCQSKGMTTQATDYTPYIQDYLNKNGVCKTNAQIQGGKVLEVKQFNCRCFDPNLPQISVSGDAICEPTPCGPVACNSAKSCSCGPGCTVSVACKWFGWKYQGGRFVPVVQGASQQAAQDVQVPANYEGGYGG